MVYQFTELDIVNELSKDDKAYRERVIEKYEEDKKVFFTFELILCLVSLAAAIVISICFFSDHLFIFLFLFFLLSFLLNISENMNKRILNRLGLIDMTPEIKRRIELMEIQINLENNMINLSGPKYNPIGFVVTDRKFQIYGHNDSVYIHVAYVLKNLINLDIVENEIECEILEVVKNCSVKAPTLDIANAKVLIPADEKGNCLLEEQKMNGLLEEQKSQSIDSN